MMDERIAVIGAGTMGLDIATAFATAGAAVIVRDINNNIISAAKARLEASLEKRVAKGKMSGRERSAILSRMSFTTELGDCKDADLVVGRLLSARDIKTNIRPAGRYLPHGRNTCQQHKLHIHNRYRFRYQAPRAGGGYAFLQPCNRYEAYGADKGRVHKR